MTPMTVEERIKEAERQVTFAAGCGTSEIAALYAKANYQLLRALLDQTAAMASHYAAANGLWQPQHPTLAPLERRDQA